MFQFADLTDRFPIRFDTDRLMAEIEDLDEQRWLAHYDVALADDWKSLALLTHDGSASGPESQRIGEWGEYKPTEFLERMPYTREVLDAFACPHGRIRITRLAPGTEIRRHRDLYAEVTEYAFGQVRLHMPIRTNPGVVFTVGGRDYHLEEGRLYYLNFSKPHSVRNDGTTPRLHLMLDLQMNDFLRGVFPQLTAREKIECALIRVLHPIVKWAPIRARDWLVGRFWRAYEGSTVQRLRHRFIPKTP